MPLQIASPRLIVSIAGLARAPGCCCTLNSSTWRNQNRHRVFAASMLCKCMSHNCARPCRHAILQLGKCNSWTNEHVSGRANGFEELGFWLNLSPKFEGVLGQHRCCMLYSPWLSAERRLEQADQDLLPNPIFCTPPHPHPPCGAQENPLPETFLQSLNAGTSPITPARTVAHATPRVGPARLSRLRQLVPYHVLLTVQENRNAYRFPIIPALLKLDMRGYSWSRTGCILAAERGKRM